MKHKEQKEIREMWEDRLEQLLFECLEIQRLPEKWSIDKNNNVVTVYPHPKVDYKCTKVLEIVYKQKKQIDLPSLLEERLRVLKVQIKDAQKSKRKIRYKRDIDKIRNWVQMYDSGVSIKEIGNQYSISCSKVKQFIEKYQKDNEEQA